MFARGGGWAGGEGGTACWLTPHPTLPPTPRHLQEREPVDAFKNPEQGGATTCFAAFHPYLDSTPGGAYLMNCGLRKPARDDVLDPEGGARLWALSEDMVGQAFDW